jgi:hypothetical protein
VDMFETEGNSFYLPSPISQTLALASNSDRAFASNSAGVSCTSLNSYNFPARYQPFPSGVFLCRLVWHRKYMARPTAIITAAVPPTAIPAFAAVVKRCVIGAAAISTIEEFRVARGGGLCFGSDKSSGLVNHTRFRLVSRFRKRTQY